MMNMLMAGIVCVLSTGDVAPDAATVCAEALENNPGLHARHDEWRAALARIPQVTSLDDPMFTYGQFITSTNLRMKLALAQKFPWFGTLRKRGEKAAAEADVALARLEAARDVVRYAAKTAYFDYAHLAERLSIATSQTELLRYIEEEMLAKLEYSLTDADDVLRVQLERERERDREAALEAMRPAFSARIDEAVGKRPGPVRPWPEAIPLPGAPEAYEVLSNLVAARNPELGMWDEAAESMEHEAALARRRGLPSFTLSAEYVSVSAPRKIRPDRPYPATLNASRRFFNTVTGQSAFDPLGTGIDLYTLGNANEPMAYPYAEDNFMVALSFNLPLHRKRVRADIEEAQLRKRVAEHERERTALSLDTETRMAHFELTDARRRHSVVTESLLPMAREVYQHLQTRLASSEAGVIDVLDAERTLLQLELDRAAALWDAHKAAARIERLTGGPE